MNTTQCSCGGRVIADAFVHADGCSRKSMGSYDDVRKRLEVTAAALKQAREALDVAYAFCDEREVMRDGDTGPEYDMEEPDPARAAEAIDVARKIIDRALGGES